MDQKCFVDAKPILKKLVYSQNYNLVFLTFLLKNMCQLHVWICCKGYNFIQKHSNSRNTLNVRTQSKVSNLVILRSVLKKNDIKGFKILRWKNILKKLLINSITSMLFEMLFVCVIKFELYVIWKHVLVMVVTFRLPCGWGLPSVWTPWGRWRGQWMPTAGWWRWPPPTSRPGCLCPPYSHSWASTRRHWRHSAGVKKAGGHSALLKELSMGE